MTKTPAIALTDAIVAYRRLPAVHHVSGRFEPGSLTAIAGPNGAGKSSLMKAIMGLLPLSEGRIDTEGTPCRRFAYLPQVPEIDRTFPISVLQTVMLGAWPRSGAYGAVSKVDRECAHACIANVGLSGYERAPIAALSTGQWHRVLFARAILQDAGVILLDEPFAALDERTTDELMQLVHGWHKEGRSVIAVLHDVAFIRKHFPMTLLLARELVAWGPTAEALSEANLERAKAMTDRWARDGAEAPRRHHDHAGHAHA
jgi:zinc/manganese transport system ATP-binding protein